MQIVMRKSDLTTCVIVPTVFVRLHKEKLADATSNHFSTCRCADCSEWMFTGFNVCQGIDVDNFRTVEICWSTTWNWTMFALSEEIYIFKFIPTY